MLLLAACTSSNEPTPAPTPTSAPTTARPWPERPVVSLRFDVAPDLLSVRGRESLRFTPDLRVCELVLRAWPNKPTTARTGNSLEVTAASVQGKTVTPSTVSAGAPEGAPGTMVTLPLPQCVDAGSTVTADVRFDVKLGPGTDERIGTDPSHQIAWFGTAFPLLAWQRGKGWVEDPAVDVVGEMATSEDFALRSLVVTAPSGFDVLGTGRAVRQGPGGVQGMTEHEFSADAVRDVTVTVGRLRTIQRDIEDVRVTLGGPTAGTNVSLEDWAGAVDRAVRRLTPLLGAVPYRDLWVSILPGVTSGVEFPGAIQLGDASHIEQWLVTHEVAHQWFYGLVGNNQAEHPWLDEGFATYAQRVADDETSHRDDPNVPADAANRIGEPIYFWTRFPRPSVVYVAGVYEAAGDALLEARRRSGEEAFDAAVREYVRKNAHTIAEPSDVRRAFAGLPEALTVLQDAGAFSP